MQRHGVVMGPQAVCTVTAELSRQARGKTMGIEWGAGQPASPIDPHNCKSQTQSKTNRPTFKAPHSKKKEQSFAPKAASLQN